MLKKRKENKKQILNEEESNNKESRILNTAFKLFIEKGVKDTSIQEIADNAEVGKGTFYLYFKDKYQIRDILIEKKSKALFFNAVQELRKKNLTNIVEEIIFIINYVIDELKKNTILLKFISKNLSWGVFSETVNNLYEKSVKSENDINILELFDEGLKKDNINLKNSKVTLHMILELVSSTCFNSILYNEPLPIEEYKPYLFETIKKMIV